MIYFILYCLNDFAKSSLYYFRLITIDDVRGGENKYAIGEATTNEVFRETME